MIYRKIILLTMLCFGSLNSYSAEPQKETEPLRLTRTEIADPSLEVLDASTIGVSLPWLNQQDIGGWFVFSPEDLADLRDDPFWSKKIRVNIPSLFTIDPCEGTTCPVPDIKKERQFVLWGNTLLTGGEPARTITITQYKLLDGDVLREHLVRRLYLNEISPANKPAACAFLKRYFGVEDLESEIARLFKKKEQATTLCCWDADDDIRAAYPMTPDGLIDFKSLHTDLSTKASWYSWSFLVYGSANYVQSDLFEELFSFRFLVSINVGADNVCPSFGQLKRFPYLRGLSYAPYNSGRTFFIKEFAPLSEMGNLEEVTLNGISDFSSHSNIFTELLFSSVLTLKKLTINGYVYNRPTDLVVISPKSPPQLYVHPSQRDFVWGMILGYNDELRRKTNVFVLQKDQKTVFIGVSWFSVDSSFEDSLRYLGMAMEKVLTWITKIHMQRVTVDRLRKMEGWFPSFNRVSSMPIPGSLCLEASLERTPYYADADGASVAPAA